MSILQEYDAIRECIGEEVYQKIESFLFRHPNLYLSDVYYNEETWKQIQKESLEY